MRSITFFAEQGIKIDPQADIGISDPVTSASGALQSVLNTTYLWAGIICVVVIIIGGYIYVTSHGNATNIKRGKDALMGAIVGLVVIIMAFVITQFIIGRF